MFYKATAVQPIGNWVKPGNKRPWRRFWNIPEGGKQNAEDRSRTFPSIAQAMAKQWGNLWPEQFITQSYLKEEKMETKQPAQEQLKVYPIILDVCQDCPDKNKCHRTFDELVRCKRIG